MKDLVETVKEMKSVFPDAEVSAKGVLFDYDFEKGILIIITPDRSEQFQKIVDELKGEGVTGIWRILKRKI